MYDFFFFKQKTAYEMRISDWSSDVCSSDLAVEPAGPLIHHVPARKSRDHDEQHRHRAHRLRLEPQPFVPRQERGQRDQHRGGENQQRMFIDPVEDQRREQRGEQSAEHAARRHDEVEERQMLRAGAEVIEIAVKRGRDDEQHRQTGERAHSTEERSGGKQWVSEERHWWWRDHKKKTKSKN